MVLLWLVGDEQQLLQSIHIWHIQCNLDFSILYLNTSNWKYCSFISCVNRKSSNVNFGDVFRFFVWEVAMQTIKTCRCIHVRAQYDQHIRRHRPKQNCPFHSKRQDEMIAISSIMQFIWMAQVESEEKKIVNGFPSSNLSMAKYPICVEWNPIFVSNIWTISGARATSNIDKWTVKSSWLSNQTTSLVTNEQTLEWQESDCVCFTNTYRKSEHHTKYTAKFSQECKCDDNKNVHRSDTSNNHQLSWAYLMLSD